MLRLKWVITISIILISCSVIFSQEGFPLLSHFQESREAKNQNWAITQDYSNTMLFANRRGVLSYDGQEWSPISLPIVPFALSTNPFDNRVYVGGENSYGYIGKDERGIYKYFSMSSDSSLIGMITKIIFTDSTIYFYSEKYISCHRSKDLSFEKKWVASDGNIFTGMFTSPENIFINISEKGLFRIEGEALFPLVTAYLTKNEEILFGLPYDKKMVLVGTDNNKLRLFDGIKFYEFPLKDDGYIGNSILSEGMAISDNLYAFTTLTGGAVVVEKYTGKVIYTLNYQNGLPDDEIFALGTDSDNGLWLSHAYGLSRADLKLPIHNFSNYPGLQGNLTSSIWYENELYVGTSEGLYYLTTINNYTEAQVVLKIKPETANVGVPVVSEPIEPVVPRKGIFAKLFGKKSNTPVDEPKSNATGTTVQSNTLTITPNSSNQFKNKTVTTLKSIDYLFKKIDGVNGKCRQLVPTPNGILVATNMGLFQVSNHRGSSVIKDTYVNYISAKTKEGNYFIGTNSGLLYIKVNNSKWIADSVNANFTEPVYSIAIPADKSLWIGGDDKAVKFEYNSGALSDKSELYSIPTDFPEQYYVQYINDTVFLLIESGMYYFDNVNEKFVTYKSEIMSLNSGFSFIISQPDSPWIRQYNDWSNLNTNRAWNRREEALLKIFDDIQSVFAESNTLWVIDGNNSLFKISMNQQSKTISKLNVYVKSVINEEGTYFELSDMVFNPGNKVVYFNIIAPNYLKERSTQYQYMVEGMMPEWSKWSATSTIIIPAEPGNFVLHVRAKDIWDNVSEEKLIHYIIKTPFTESTIFFILILLVAFISILMIVKVRENKLLNDKKILEAKVVERTAEIEAQKKEITSSIQYASRIQMAMLPENEHLANTFSEHFIIFKPRDIVSGDFYWFNEDDDHIYFTTADCTGHGVPGAFMSMLGISALQEITSNFTNLKASAILDMLRGKIKKALHQTGKEGEASDGMDMAMCILHKKSKLLEFAGAYIPIYVVHDKQFIEYKADRMPIGIYHGKKESFTNNEIEVNKGDTIYFLSDGYIDQFGGPDGAKFKRANLKKLLTEIANKPFCEQKEILTARFESWKGPLKQVDDVTVIGLKI